MRVGRAAPRLSWEDQAENWLAWARTPGHDAYWYPMFLMGRCLKPR